MNKSDRLKALVSYYSNGSNSQFANKLGLTPQAISGWIARNTYDTELIFAKCENVSPLWLLTGEGAMLKSQATAVAEPEPPQYVSKNRDICQIDRSKFGATRPRIPFTAAAGALSISADSATESDCERFPVIPNFPDYDFTIKVDGESMCPVFQPDDELACRLIDDAHEVKWGQPYILDTVDGVVLKTLYDGGDNILCKSINKEGPEPYEVSKTDILHIASIVGFTRQLQP